MRLFQGWHGVAAMGRPARGPNSPYPRVTREGHGYAPMAAFQMYGLGRPTGNP